ncbi:MAG: DUF1080 domain-containing protein [Saprospiraceae bacterium]|nr:DUF1080 domain-containing protein [Saprospiraceae bacterium]
MVKLFLGLVIINLGACQSAGVPNENEEWLPLFNGANLENWTPKIRGHTLDDNFGQTFQVTDGTIVTNYDAYDEFDQRFGHLFYKDPFSHYRLRISYRFFGEQAKNGPGWAIRNSGIMLHCQAPNTIGLDQDFPISIEAQLLGGNGKDPRSTMNLCTPGTEVLLADTILASHCTSSASKTYHGDQWVEAEALVLGDSLLIHYVEGNEVLRYSKPQIGGGVVNDFDPMAKKDGKPLSEGYISLQSESHPVAFRKVELLNLCGCMDKRAKNYKPYFICSRPKTCLY